jgi:hypothetical protein
MFGTVAIRLWNIAELLDHRQVLWKGLLATLLRLGR